MESMSLPPTHKEISCAEVRARLEGGRPVRLADVRQPWEYERGHIPGALQLPLDEFAARFALELDPAEEIICVCEHGIRSAAAARYLAAQGYPNVATMTGGMAEYAGLVEVGDRTSGAHD
jgi:rhodanese-related sulfurtransferase